MGINERFKELLRQGLHSIKTHEGRNLAVIQDELGYELGGKEAVQSSIGNAAIRHRSTPTFRR